GPIDLETMFAMGDGLVNGTEAGAGPPELQPPIDQADPPRERHRRAKSVAENPPARSGPVKRYRTSSLAKPAPSKQTALAQRIDQENARLDRAMKGICRGC